MLFHSRLFHYNVDDMPWELNSCLYQLAYGKSGVVYTGMLKVTEPLNDIQV